MQYKRIHLLDYTFYVFNKQTNNNTNTSKVTTYNIL